MRAAQICVETVLLQCAREANSKGSQQRFTVTSNVTEDGRRGTVTRKRTARRVVGVELARLVGFCAAF